MNEICLWIEPCHDRSTCPVLTTAKAKGKGCKGKKCSNWKGGRCRCGRD